MSPARSSGSVETTRATWAKMMNASEYSDFIIKCHTKTFHVHRVVVCTQSKPIQAAANGNFRESITGILDLEDDDPCTVARMIHFLYLQDYDDGEEEAEAPARGRLLVNAMVYVLADKYDVPALQARARDKYEEALATAWDPLSFVASLELAYEQLPETDTRLTALALRAAGQHVRELGGCEEFGELCRSHPVIAYDLFVNAASAQPVAPLSPAEMETEMETKIPSPAPSPTQTQTRMKNGEACPKGHGFMHMQDMHSRYHAKSGRWRVKCGNCAMQKVFYREDNSCDVEARWDGVDAGYWFL